MKGGIYPNKGRGAPWTVRFPGVYRRMWDYKEAERFLTGLRFQEDQGTFDPRDWQRDEPLGFENLAQKWLKRNERKRSIGHMRNHINHAESFLGNKNIKQIGFAELDDLFEYLRETTTLGEKSLFNIKTTLHSFFTWVCRREKIPVPDFPKIKFTLGWRKIIDKETQGKILDELYRISAHHNPKIWLYALMLSTYTNVRPIELLSVKEEDIDLEHGIIIIKHNKVPDQYKRIYLLEDDNIFISKIPKGFPKSYFFRHTDSAPTEYRGKQIARRRMQKWWDKACAGVGVNGVSLYPGTRHSSIVELGEHYSPEEIKQDGSGHSTDKAFNRYYQMKADKKREISARARCAQDVHHLSEHSQNDNSLKSKRQIGRDAGI